MSNWIFSDLKRLIGTRAILTNLDTNVPKEAKFNGQEFFWGFLPFYVTIKQWIIDFHTFLSKFLDRISLKTELFSWFLIFSYALPKRLHTLLGLEPNWKKNWPWKRAIVQGTYGYRLHSGIVTEIQKSRYQYIIFYNFLNRSE